MLTQLSDICVRTRTLLCVLITSSVFCQILRAQSFTQIVSFGDSWSDAGNANIISSGIALPTITAPYANGRYTNGFTWVDYLSSGVGLDYTSPSLWGGNNYAVGGAHAEDGTFTSGIWTIDEVGQQVNTYLQQHTPTGTELITLFAGGNDIADGDTDLSDEIARIGSYITQLYNAGARHFMIPTMADFSKISGYITHPTAGTASISYNNLLDTEIENLISNLEDITFYRPDFYGVLNEVYNDPTAYGFAPHLKNANFSDLFEFYLWYDPRGPISNYIWIDPIHPTDHLHSILAQAALESLNTPITHAPEPGSAMLFLFGGSSILTLCSRRRTQMS